MHIRAVGVTVVAQENAWTRMEKGARIETFKIDQAPTKAIGAAATRVSAGTTVRSIFQNFQRYVSVFQCLTNLSQIFKNCLRFWWRPESTDWPDVPPEAEWFANIQNQHTRDAYKRGVSSFIRFVGIRKPEDFRTITRAHVINVAPCHKAASSVGRQLSALSSLMDYFCD